MSHIPRYEDEERKKAATFTPLARDRGRGVKDFASTYLATPSPPTFSTFATPSRKKVIFETDLVAGIEEEEHPKSLEDLLAKTWKIHRLSPLFNYDPADIQSLGDYLNQNLNNQSAGFVIGPRDSISVKVATIPGLRGNREDADSLKITVGQRTSNKVLAVLHLLAVNATETSFKTSTMTLPLALTSGISDVVQVVFEALSRLYDCVVSPRTLNEVDLKWMAALWSDWKDPDADHVIKLRYSMPSNLKNCGINVIDIKLEAKNFCKFWAKICSKHDTTEGELTIDDMERFHAFVQDFVRDHYGIKLDMLTLSAITLPYISATADGHIRIDRLDLIKTVLGFLTDICQEDMITSAHPRMGFAIDQL